MCLLTCPSIYQSISSIKRPIINTEYNLSYHIMSSSSLSLDHLPPSEQLCYVHCNICDTILAVYISIYHFLTHFTSLSRFFFSSFLNIFLCFFILQVSVPCTSLFKTVTVRCGHCTNLLPVNMRALLLPSPNQFHLGHSFFSPTHNLLVSHKLHSLSFFNIVC